MKSPNYLAAHPSPDAPRDENKRSARRIFQLYSAAGSGGRARIRLSPAGARTEALREGFSARKKVLYMRHENQYGLGPRRSDTIHRGDGSSSPPPSSRPLHPRAIQIRFTYSAPRAARRRNEEKGAAEGASEREEREYIGQSAVKICMDFFLLSRSLCFLSDAAG